MKLIKYVEEMGRSSSLEGIFIVTDEEFKTLEQLDGQDIYLGEVSGKHSEVTITFEFDNVEILSEEESEINIVERLIGNDVGFRWRHYLLERVFEEMWENVPYDYENFNGNLSIVLKNNGYEGIMADKYTEIWKQHEEELKNESK
jgi:hypothetical protein